MAQQRYESIVEGLVLCVFHMLTLSLDVTELVHNGA